MHVFFSCSLQKRLSKAEELSLIKTSYEQGDVLFLIEALEKYPQYRGYIEAYLYNNDYSRLTYGKLSKCAEKAKKETELFAFFDSLRINKQAFILDSLSSLGISEVATFYKSSYIEHDYLEAILKEVYFSDVRSLDYINRKTLYKAFKNTNLCSEIEKPYHDLRDSLLSDIMGVFNPYFESERAILKQIETAIRYESQEYVKAGIEKIIVASNEKNDRGFFKKVFNRSEIDQYSFQEYINRVINNTYDSAYIENITKERLLEYLASSKEMRSTLFNNYFNDYEYQDIYINDDIINTPLLWIIGRDNVSYIQNIKDIETALTILGFVPGIGTLGIIVDGVDLIYGMTQNGRIHGAIEQLANTVYNDSSLCINDYLTKVFNDLTKSQQVTENHIRKIFNDEF